MVKLCIATRLAALQLLLVGRPAAALQKIAVPPAAAQLAPVSLSEEATDNDGGFWPLFPAGKVPGEIAGLYTPMKDGPPDPTDPIGNRCAPGERTGRWIYNVTVPGLVPRIVPKTAPNFKNAAVIVMPGGGYSFLAWTKEGLEIADWLNTIGISAFVLKYRVPQRPWLGITCQAAFQDAQRAVSLVRSKAKKLGLNASRIGSIGFSAGGHLSTVVNSEEKRLYTPLDEVDKLSPRYDFQLIVYGTGTFFRATPNVGPTFIAFSRNDQCTPFANTLAYYASLRISGLKNELHVFPDGGHGYGLCKEYPPQWYEVCTWPSLAQTFIEHQVLLLPPPGDNPR